MMIRHYNILLELHERSSTPWKQAMQFVEGLQDTPYRDCAKRMQMQLDMYKNKNSFPRQYLLNNITITLNKLTKGCNYFKREKAECNKVMTYDEDEESYSDDDDFEQHPKTFFTKFTPSDKYSPQQEHPRGRGYNDSRRSAPGRDGGRGRGRGRSTQPDRSAGFDRTRPNRRPTSEPPRKNKEQCSVCKMFGHGPHEDDCWLLPRILCATEWIKNNTSKCPSIMSRYTKTNSMNYRQ